MREYSIEQSFVRAAKKRLWVTFKLCGVVGIPDRVVLCEGKAVFLEFKTPSGVLSAPQKAWILELQHIGFNASVVRSVDDAVRYCELSFK